MPSPSFAVNLPNRDVKQVRVLIAFEGEPGDAGLIGRHVRVLITEPAPSKLQEGVCWLFSRLGD